MISSTVSTLTVLLIVLFLFREGIGVFSEKPVEKNYSLLVNKENPIDHLSPQQIKNIYDQKITNWKEISGTDQPILLLTINDLGNYFSQEEMGENFEYLPQKLDTLIGREKRGHSFYQ